MRTWSLLDGSGIPSTNTIITPPEITPSGPTSFEIEVDTANMIIEPTSYVVKYTDTSTNIETTVTKTSNPFTVSGLSQGRSYKFEIIPYYNAEAGRGIKTSQTYTLDGSFAGNAILGSTRDPRSITAPSKNSYLTLSVKQGSKKPVIATRQFEAISIPNNITYTPISGASNQNKTYPTYPDGAYYSFGTSFIMSSKQENPLQGGGLGFFTNELGTRGYYLLISTIPSAIAKGTKTVRIVKAKGQDLIVLKDSQVTPGATLDSIFGGTVYNVSIKVRVKNKRVNIIAYINGFKITATDTTEIVNERVNRISGVTDKLSIVCTSGSIDYDYVFGKSITEEEYKTSSNLQDIYQGQFSNDTLSSSFGDLVYFAAESQEALEKENSIIKDSVDEFGTVVRELRKVSTGSYEPSHPLSWSKGVNDGIKILSSSVTPFKSEAYVLNNTSSVVPLADDINTFGIYGNTIAPSGDIEYNTDVSTEYSSTEPIVINSRWLQSESDVKQAADWIKSKVVNKGKLVTAQVFGNPLINVGDIVTINYPFQGFDGTQKFIVTAVSHGFSQGLETTVTCRTL